MEIVQQRNITSLLPTVHMAPGTIIHRDDEFIDVEGKTWDFTMTIAFTNIMRDIVAQYIVP